MGLCHLLEGWDFQARPLALMNGKESFYLRAQVGIASTSLVEVGPSLLLRLVNYGLVNGFDFLPTLTIHGHWSKCRVTLSLPEGRKILSHLFRQEFK